MARRVMAFCVIHLMVKRPPLVVELVLGVLQIAVHQQLAGVLNVRVAVGHGFAVRGGQLAQHPGGQIVLRVWLGPDADAGCG